jgi:hypothetical protein
MTLQNHWTPAFAGVTTSYEVVFFDTIFKVGKTATQVMPAEAGIRATTFYEFVKKRFP